MRQPEIDLASPEHPRLPLSKEEADLLLTLLKVDFAIRVSGAVKAGGPRHDPAEVMEEYQVSDNLEMVIAVSYVLLNIFAGLSTSIPCPMALQSYIRNVVSAPTLNDPEIMTVNEEAHSLFFALQERGPGILAKLKDLEPATFPQFEIKGPARA